MFALHMACMPCAAWANWVQSGAQRPPTGKLMLAEGRASTLWPNARATPQQPRDFAPFAPTPHTLLRIPAAEDAQSG